MAVDGYFVMQPNLIVTKQNFQFYPPGIRTNRAKLAGVFPSKTLNFRGGQASPQLTIVSNRGNIFSALQSACCTNEVLQEVRLDLWDGGITEFGFTLRLFNARVSQAQSPHNLNDAVSGFGTGNGNTHLASNINFDDWHTFGFHFSSLQTTGALPTTLRPLLTCRGSL